MPLSRFLTAVLAWAVPAVACAGPRDDLLRLVPDDYTFCVVGQNVRDALGKAAALQRLAATPLVKLLRDSDEGRKAGEMAEFLMKELEVTPAQVRDDLLGDVVVFAYRKGPAGRPDQEDGLFLVHARDPALLARVVGRVNDAQTRNGEIKAVEALDGYSRRVKPDGAVRDYFALDGAFLAYSTKEGLLRTTLTKRKAAEVGETGEPAVGRRLAALGVADAPVVCLVNPRSFDADLAAAEKEAGGSEKGFVGRFRGFWSAVDGLALALRAAPDLELGLALNVRSGDLAPAAAQFFGEARKRSPLWSVIPDDALFAAAGRVHVESLAAVLSTILTDQDRVKVAGAVADAARPFLESDDLGPLLTGLGPDVGYWVTAPQSGDGTWVPRTTLAVKVAPTPEGKAAATAALKGLDFLARLVALDNRDVRVRSADGTTYLTSDKVFPPGFKPAFAAKGGYVVLAGSPEGIARFTPPAGEAAPAEEVPLVRISVRAWKDYVKAHGPALAAFAADKKGQDAATVARQLEAVGPLLEGFEKVELVQRSAPGRTTLLLRLHLTK